MSNQAFTLPVKHPLVFGLVASSFFFAVAIIVGFGSVVLNAFAQSFACWGDGATKSLNPEQRAVNGVCFVLLNCSYFVVSAVGMLFAGRRKVLSVFAVVAHSLLIIAVCIFFRDAGRGNIEAVVFVVFLIGLVFFPFFLVWTLMFAIVKDNRYSPSRGKMISDESKRCGSANEVNVTNSRPCTTPSDAGR
ncbi:MAG: hypothetical protein HZA88_08295 [Verrucomicrobia bacterium]|nr:hypothetical protein [Verrucomicrobiota bacterium]